MFTGIVETLGQIQRIEKEGTNVHFWIESEITSELQIDQSVAHNGVCLTVIEIDITTTKIIALPHLGCYYIAPFLYYGA